MNKDTARRFAADVGVSLRGVRQDRGVSAVELTRRSGISKTRLWAIETGRATQFSVAEFVRLTQALGMSPDEAADLLMEVDGWRVL